MHVTIGASYSSFICTWMADFALLVLLLWLVEPLLNHLVNENDSLKNPDKPPSPSKILRVKLLWVFTVLYIVGVLLYFGYWTMTYAGFPPP